MHAAGIAVILATALLALPAPVAAQPDSPDPPSKPARDLTKAGEHYQLAEKAAAEKRWSDAAREYGVAYEHSRDPVLFFKLAGAFQQAGDCASALVYYKRYLAEAKPNEEYQKLAGDQIASCEASIKAGSKTEPEHGSGTGSGDGTGTGDSNDSGAGDGAGTEDSTLSPFETDDESPTLPAGPPDSDPSLGTEPSWQRTAAWISVGVAVALGTTSGVLGLAAGSREDDINAQIDFRDPTQNVPARFEGNVAERYDDLVDQGDRFELLSLISLGAAGAAVGAAVVFFILDPGPDAADGSAALPALTPAIGRDTIGVSAGWSFE